MKLFLIVGETPFFQPNFIRDLLHNTNTEDKWVGAALIIKEPVKADLEKYLRSCWRYLSANEMAKLGCKKYSYLFRDTLPQFFNGDNFYSVHRVLTKHQVDWFAVDHDINDVGYLSRIEQAKPDIIISSGPMVFRQKLLSLPKRSCLNRHSALLPAYGGLWPVFHAVANGEKEVGVSASCMEAGIDKGAALAQKVIPIQAGDTVWKLYEKTFSASAPTMHSAINRIRSADLTPVKNKYAESYHSFPTPEDWKKFRDHGGSFI